MKTIKNFILVFISLFLTALVTLSSHASDLVSNAVVSNLAGDETIQFFRTSAWFDEQKATWMVPIHGWVYQPTDSRVRKAGVAKVFEKHYGLIVSSDNEEIFSRRVNLLLSDNERNKRIVITVAGKTYELPSTQPNGHFQATLALPQEAFDSVDQAFVQYRAVLPTHDDRHFQGESVLLARQGLSIISDIDDTVKRSYVTERKKLVQSTFFENFTAVEGMSEHYRMWAEQGASFHFVSSSPWHLYAPLTEFLIANDFPWADLSLKAIRFRDDTFFDLFKKGTETKPKAIKSILSRYPNRQFILVGDSGEQDAEVYASIAQDYPDQIKQILIRNDSESKHLSLNDHFETIFSEIPRNKWQVFIVIDEVDKESVEF